MSTVQESMKRFMPDSQYTMEEEGRDVIIAKPLDPTVQEDMLREARLAGIATKETTIDELYDLFAQEGFREEIIEEASRRRPMLIRERTNN